MTNTTPSNAAGNSSSSSDKRKRFLQYKYRYKRKNTNSSSTPNLPTTNSNNNPNAINNANNTPVESQPSRLGRSKNTTKINPIPRTFRPTILDEADLNPIQKQNLVKIVEYVELYHKDDLEHSIVHSNHTKEIRGGTKNHYTIRIQYDIALLLDIIESNSIQNSTSDLPQLIATACFKKLSQMTRQRIFTEFVEVIVCPKSLPYVHFDQQLSVKKFFQTEKLGSMVPFKCLVSNLALPEFYNHSYYYKCINDTCINQHTSHIVKIPVYGDYHVTKRSQNGELIERTLICDLKQLELFCKACNEVQEEIVAERISKIQQSGGLTVLNQDGCSFHTLHFLQRGSLSPDIEIGDYVEVICSLNSKIDLDSKKLTPIMHFDVELHNIRKIEFCFGNSLRKEVSMGTLKSKLNDDMTPFEFSQTIVSELCSNMLQNHVWRKLRLCLLLSLSSITELNSVDSQPVHILIVTDAYTPLLSRLISYTASLKRNTKWNELVLDGKPNPFVQISKDNQFDFHVQSAKDGVLTVPIDSLNPAKLKELKSRLKQPSIDIYLGEQSCTYNINSVVWAYSESFRRNKQTGLSTLLTSFDLVVNLSELENTDLEQSIVDSILVNEMEPTVEESSSELWDYLKLISKLETHLSDEAKEFLSTYVSALRKVAGDSLPKSTSEVTMTLYRIAAAHTKLCNRVETIIDDAMVAIMLLEESFACAYQCSLLGIESKGQDVEFIYQLLDGDISDSTRNEYFQALYEKLLLVLQFD